MPFEPDDAVHAVIAPPKVKRFRELVGIADDEAITADFSGWSKLVLLTRELAILFPRDHTHAPYLAAEVEALRAVAPLRIGEVPEIVGVFADEDVCAHAFVVESRLRGTLLDECVRDITPDELGDALEQVARLAARWHAADPGLLATRPPRPHPAEAFVDELLRPGGSTHVDVELTARERATFEAAVGRVRRLERVVVHGDLHEGQILVDDDLNVTGILDWQTARRNHPFTEFDLGEWGTGAWRAHHRAFPVLRRRMWTAYAAERGLDAGLADDFDVFWSVVQAHRWPMSVHVGSDVTGTWEHTVAAMKNALGGVTPDR